GSATVAVKVAHVKIEFPGSSEPFCVSWVGCSGGADSITGNLMVDRRYEVQGAAYFKVLADGTCDGNGVSFGGHPIQLTCSLVTPPTGNACSDDMDCAGAGADLCNPQTCNAGTCVAGTPTPGIANKPRCALKLTASCRIVKDNVIEGVFAYENKSNQN